jgi:VIT1/CCC1 family predicted Fe2+/Mn2+ transporter
MPKPPEQPESPRVRELSQRLARTIDEFQRQYPMKANEIRQALRIAAGETSRGERSAGLPLIVGALVFAGLAGVLFFQASGEGGPWITVVLVGTILIAVGLIVARRKG